MAIIPSCFRYLSTESQHLNVHLVSATSIGSEVPEDGVILLPAIDNQREVVLVDPTLLFETDDQNNNGPPSDNTGPSDTSTEKVRHSLANETGTNLKYWINDNPGSDLLNYLKKARIQLENETVHSSDPESTRILGKGLSKNWFNNKPSPSLVVFLRELTTQPLGNDVAKLPHSKLFKTISRQGLENEISERWRSSDSGPSDPFLFLERFKKPVSENETTYLPNSRLSTPRRVERKELALDPMHWLTNDSGSSNLSISLKRSRRQTENETEELAELPGMPQGVLRDLYTKTSRVKRKLLGMMLQSLYSAQERLWPLANIVNKYDGLAPYRMAFIFMKLDQLVHEGHSIFMYLKRQALDPKMTMTKRLQLYSQIMRRNIDLTYLVEYIMERVPQDQIVRIRQWVIRHEQEQLMKKKETWDKTYGTAYAGRPPK